MSMSDSSSEWSWQLRAELAAIRPAASSFRAWLRERIDPAIAADCELALVEACNNLVLHNPKSRAPILLRAEANPWQATIWIEDSTDGFDWPSNPAMPPPDAENGRGIVLIQSLMTRVEYRRLGASNELCLRRNLDPKGESAAADSGNG